MFGISKPPLRQTLIASSPVFVTCHFTLPSFTGPQFTLYTIVEPFGMSAPSFSSARISPEGNLTVAVIVAFGLRACMGKPNGCLCGTDNAYCWLIDLSDAVVPYEETLFHQFR